MNDMTVVNPPAGPPAEEQFNPLTQEEYNDLRMRVLAGYEPTVEEARRVCETLRGGQGAAQMIKDAKPRKRKAKEALSDQDLDASLSSLGL